MILVMDSEITSGGGGGYSKITVGRTLALHLAGRSRFCPWYPIWSLEPATVFLSVVPGIILEHHWAWPSQKTKQTNNKRERMILGLDSRMIQRM